MPLHVEILYNEYQFAAAFAVASLLALLALVTLAAKVALESRASFVAFDAFSTANRFPLRRKAL
jgi:ABC-type sulfate transport system permease subunit